MTPEEVSEMADMARNGLHDLNPWWSPDVEGLVDPLDDPDTVQAMKTYIQRRWTTLSAMRQEQAAAYRERLLLGGNQQ